jgi:hypothetical protein
MATSGVQPPAPPPPPTLSDVRAQKVTAKKAFSWEQVSPADVGAGSTLDWGSVVKVKVLDGGLGSSGVNAVGFAQLPRAGGIGSATYSGVVLKPGSATNLPAELFGSKLMQAVRLKVSFLLANYCACISRTHALCSVHCSGYCPLSFLQFIYTQK